MSKTLLDRAIFEISGTDRYDFLEGLVTNHIAPDSPLTYTALLTPQGKYIADFFLLPHGDKILLDVFESLSATLIQRLTMYKLRADVTITPSNLNLHRGITTPPIGSHADPRHPDMGWRLYSDTPTPPNDVDWDAIRVAHCIPESGIELTSDTYILEAGFEALNGVDFKKGCYVGQEIAARMKHKAELKKGLKTVQIDKAVPVGTPITSNGKPAGHIFTQSGNQAIAYLRFDRIENMQADGANVSI
ncbi:YgfZ/GcvT domain-containing protein [Parasulfitobacter algicola]|uniref:Folate-binding protein YgfZ n=1 Tax=Parasulfitobacter algicola TaxID=2614809 RepID=A0ABX2IX95_9RHOB|nr:folate-binding protein YgfZ [Sulfitobacter algicola]NSX54958.1 folate-binding protein YgfZ [Sulfitobacter algicola]